MEIMYSICFVFKIKSCASSRCAAAKVVGVSGRCSGNRVLMVVSEGSWEAGAVDCCS